MQRFGLWLVSRGGFAIVLALTTHTAFAQRPDRHAGECWSPPAAETLEELGYLATTKQERTNRQNQTRKFAEPAILALSDGQTRIAYGGGLIVGWGETGYRPAFAAVLAVGRSVLLAPFAFLGDEGDVKITSLLNCYGAKNWTELSERAVLLIDGRVVSRIAQRHSRGARLIIALPGSPVRPETVWDLGAIAASGHPGAIETIGNLIRAAADPTRDVQDIRSGAGRGVVRNWVFRKVGSGEPFLSPLPQSAPGRSYFVIHNGVLFADESDDFATQAASSQSPKGEFSIVTAFDLLKHAQSENALFRFASVRPRLDLENHGAFDDSYVRNLFHFAYRQGRMGKEWRDDLPTEKGASRR